LRQRLLKIRYDPPSKPKAWKEAGSIGAKLQESDPPRRPLVAEGDGLQKAELFVSDPPSKPIVQKTEGSEEGKSYRDAFHEITRGDLRLTSKKPEVEQRLWFYFHHHPDEILATIGASNAEYTTILTELLLLMNLLFLLDETILETINGILPLINAHVQPERIDRLVKQVIVLWQQKFDAFIRS
jgi:hypothetical protein